MMSGAVPRISSNEARPALVIVTLPIGAVVRPGSL